MGIAGRIHVTGASGSGVSTLGRALAAATGSRYFDTDDYYWLPTATPYQVKRDPDDCRRRLRADLKRAGRIWVLGGSLDCWGEPLVPMIDRVVFLSTPTDIRIARLRARETARFGAEALAPGGELHDQHEAFIAWAADYESGWRAGRSRPRHEGWLAALDCPVIKLDGTRSVPELVAAVLAADEAPDWTRSRVKTPRALPRFGAWAPA